MQTIQPLFILGNPRSGTSLLRIMLNHHPQIVSPPESGFAHWWLEKYKDWEEKDMFTTRLDEFIIDLFTSKKIETWKLNESFLREIITKNIPSNYGDLIACVYLAYSEDHRNIKIVIDKNNYYIKHIEDLSKIWINSKFIHLIRDGRDVACSYLDMNTLKSDSEYKPELTTSISKIAKEWKENNKSISSLDKFDNSYYLIKYEDLILKPEETLKSLCWFLKIKFSQDMLEYYKESDSKKVEPSETLDWKKRTQKKPDAKRIGRYKEALTNEEVQKFSEIASTILRRYNYY